MTPSGSAAEPVVAVEHALTRFMRQATRPALAKWLSAIGGVSLDRADYVALTRIDEAEPIRISELADILGIDLSAVSRQVRDLVESALVERSKDAADQRAVQLRLTEKGRALLARVRLARQESMRHLLAGWCESDQRALARLVGRLATDMEMQVPPESQPFGAAAGPGEGPAPVGAGRPGSRPV